MHDAAEQKAAQRRNGIAARKALPADQALLLSQIICEQLAAHPAYACADTIFTYSPFGGEVDVRLFNQRAEQEGKTVAYPICHGEGKMIAAVPDGPSAWEKGKYGIFAPLENRSRILSPLEINLVVVPCTAFDGKRKTRVGMGAGYYDRYLPQCRNATWIAVAYEVQHHSDICREPWDVALHAIITESSLWGGGQNPNPPPYA